MSADAEPRGLVEAVATLLGASGVDAFALARAWARAAGVVTLVPAFGLGALPRPARALVALALAWLVWPALGPSSLPTTAPWPLALAAEAARGLPVAIAAAVPLWAATSVGGLADALRGATGDARLAVVEGRATPLGALTSMLASYIFLATGGTARVASALVAEAHVSPLDAAARDLASGISVALAIGAPLLVASLVLEVASALVARASTPAQIAVVIAPAKSLGLLAVMALLLDRVAAALALAVRGAP